MKKHIILLITAFSLLTVYSCQEDDLNIFPENLDPLENAITRVDQLQNFLNGAYVKSSSGSAYGAESFIFGDLLSDNIFVSNSASSYLLSYNMTYSAVDNEFKMYPAFYDVIQSCNIVINNTSVVVPESEIENLMRIKAEASILRAISYFNLVSNYSATPTSGLHQELGVPLVLGDYDPNIQPPRATVAEVYSQIIADLNYGIQHASEIPPSKVFLSKTAAKLFLSRVYLTRRAEGDAQLALNLATDVVNNSPAAFASISPLNTPATATQYSDYFAANDSSLSEDKPETIWEVDLNSINNPGVNSAIAVYYHRTGARRSFLFRKSFYDSFPSTDIRLLLFSTQGIPQIDNPTGVWTNKWVRLTSEGVFARNNKVLRFAEAQLNRIEALYLTGQTGTALTELNEFAQSRAGNTYSGADLLNDILTERQKEFFGEGYRFYDLKRYNLPIVKVTNCNVNCNLPANDTKFVFPMSESALSFNSSLTQYPGY